ncbi:MAG: putative glycoside hydrolase, partial [Pseudoalteromonas sp.]
DEWQTLNIDLSCFAEQGINLAQVFSPWQLSTAAPWQVSIAKLSIIAERADNTAIACQ